MMNHVLREFLPINKNNFGIKIFAYFGLVVHTIDTSKGTIENIFEKKRGNDISVKLKHLDLSCFL